MSFLNALYSARNVPDSTPPYTRLYTELTRFPNQTLSSIRTLLLPQPMPG